MKLNTLHENKFDLLDLENKLAGISQDKVKWFEQFLQKFNRFPVTKVVHRQNVGTLKIFLSNSLVDIVLEIDYEASTGGLEELFTLELFAFVNADYVASDPEHTSNYNRALSDSVSEALTIDDITSSSTKNFIEATDNYIRAIDTFTEWYFDISGTHGKVKLKKLSTSTFKDSDSIKEDRWVPVIGSFYFSGYKSHSSIHSEIL